MKKFIKNNYMLIIVCLIFIMSGTLSVVNYCQNSPVIKQFVLKQERNKCLLNNNQEYCDNYNYEIANRDTISTLIYNVSISDYSSFVIIISPLLVMIVSSIYFYQYLRRGYIINAISRIGYKKAVTTLYLKTLKYALILPMYIFIMFIVSYFLSGHFDYELGLKLYGSIGFNATFAKHWIIFIIFYIINFGLNSVFWINIAVWNIKHNKNLLVSIIVSYIEFILLDVIIEMFGVGFFQSTSYLEYFSLFNLWSFHNVTLFGGVFESLLFVIITILIVYNAYHDKEKILEEISK